MRDGPTYIAVVGPGQGASVYKRRTTGNSKIGTYQPYADARTIVAAKRIARTMNDAEESE